MRDGAWKVHNESRYIDLNGPSEPLEVETKMDSGWWKAFTCF